MEARKIRKGAERLVLGGHSFIRQLGSDPRPEEAEQVRLVETCLDGGLVWFDTTYQPERVALGRALRTLGRRDEAVIIAWNFFQVFDGSGAAPVGGADFHRADRLPRMLEELQTDRIDCLVVHSTGDATGDAAQEALAVAWKVEGIVGRLGMWQLSKEALARHNGRGPYDFMVHPRNVTTGAAADEALAAAKAAGLMTLACSPFVRGWELEKYIATAVALHGLTEASARQRLADHLLRYALFAPTVDRLIVSMRQSDWVGRNLDAVERGALTEEERQWLTALKIRGASGTSKRL